MDNKKLNIELILMYYYDYNIFYLVWIDQWAEISCLHRPLWNKQICLCDVKWRDAQHQTGHEMPQYTNLQ